MSFPSWASHYWIQLWLTLKQPVNIFPHFLRNLKHFKHQRVMNCIVLTVVTFVPGLFLFFLLCSLCVPFAIPLQFSQHPLSSSSSSLLLFPCNTLKIESNKLRLPSVHTIYNIISTRCCLVEWNYWGCGGNSSCLNHLSVHLLTWSVLFSHPSSSLFTAIQKAKVKSE